MAPSPIPPNAQITYEVCRTAHLLTNAAFTSTGAEGVLYTITVNTKGATGNIATIAIDGATLGIIDTTLGSTTLFYQLKYNTTLSVTMSVGTAADLTITYL